jgi:tmRNA-binding protein
MRIGLLLAGTVVELSLYFIRSYMTLKLCVTLASKRKQIKPAVADRDQDRRRRNSLTRYLGSLLPSLE